MKPAQPSHSQATWGGPAPRLPSSHPAPVAAARPSASDALPRLWSTLMSARVLIALAVLALHLAVDRSDQPVPPAVLGLCTAYAALAVLGRALLEPRSRRPPRDVHWRYAVGVDIVFFSGLQWAHSTDINYTPLLVLPVLLASIMGSRLLALGTAALITLLLLAHATWLAGAASWNSTAHLPEAGLSGAGLLLLAWLSSQLSARLRRQEAAAERNEAEARTQARVSHLVTEALPDGVLVIDAARQVRAINPAARAMLCGDPAALAPGFELRADAAWQPLLALAQRTFDDAPVQETAISLRPGSAGEQRLLAHTRLTRSDAGGEAGLCVMFLRDLRAIEAQLHTEKLAAMGRMSVAVAHEIRNPLAAISQANALLAEELSAPAQRQLTAMVQQNALRLQQIVDDILEATRRPGPWDEPGAAVLALDEQLRRFAQEWARQHAAGDRLRLNLRSAGVRVRFEPEHLRRVLVNLLDNAARHASARAGAIQVHAQQMPRGLAELAVWSDGPPLPDGVRRHLFEPFSSSDSRSSGLGLFICRELCERHGASIAYRRIAREQDGQAVEGNEFWLAFQSAERIGPPPAAELQVDP